MILRRIIVKSLRGRRAEGCETSWLEKASLGDRRHADNLPVYPGVNAIWEATRPLACLDLQLGNQ